jgi:hypothetical protein
VDWWNGQNSAPGRVQLDGIDAARDPAASDGGGGYNAVGSRLNAGPMNINQASMKTVDGLIAKYGTTQAISLLNSNITSAAAVAAGFTPPYANLRIRGATLVL